MADEDDPKPKSYRPYVAARYPGPGRPPIAPEWRILVHRKHVEAWNRILEVAGESNAGELWLHLATQPDQPPLLGTVTPMKGKQYAAKGDWSRIYHYELTGASRVDYRFDPKHVAEHGDEHPVVQIVSIDLGSH